MNRALLGVSLSHWRRSPGQAFLPAIGVAIGVAAIVAVEQGSLGTVESFRFTMERLEGKAPHQVRPGRTPLDPQLAFALADHEDDVLLRGCEGCAQEQAHEQAAAHGHHP